MQSMHTTLTKLNLRILLFSLFISCTFGCTPQGDPVIGERFCDNFSRPSLGDHWSSKGNYWRIENGELKVSRARNHPLWLRRRLPRDARVTFSVRSNSPEGDIKVEMYGDGVSYATTDSYTATSYVIIFGGWGNTLNVLARMNEHGSDRIKGPPRSVQQGQTYQFKIERRGQRITAWVDDQPLVSMNDSNPLVGDGHDHFAFNNWMSELTFDNFCVEPL